MKKVIVLIFALLVLIGLYAQNIQSPGIDCNPRLNEKEISYLNKIFSEQGYDFRNKIIAFASHKVKRICRTATNISLSMSHLITKKEFFDALARDSCKKIVAKLFPLNADQKKESKGFDAIIFIVPRKKEKKINAEMTDRFAVVLGYRTLNYPDNLHLVGTDNSIELTDEDVILFNRIYHHKGFDFRGKKIAFMNPHLQGQEAIRSKKEFIQKIKKHLETDFLYPASEDLATLSGEEKKEAGGYDAMIVYQSKRYYKDKLIKILKEKKTAP